MSGLNSTTMVANVQQIIPIQAVPAQTFNVQLNQQNTQINIYQRHTGLYVDLGVNGTLIIGGVLVHDRNWIVRDAYLGFIGDIAFWDSQGLTDPVWSLLNIRYFLGYWSP